jgi:hypothetical protein
MDIGRKRGRFKVCHKTIPVATLCLDDALCLPAVTNSASHGTQAALHGGITDGEPLPHLVAQFLLGDHTVTMLDEIAEHLEDLRSQSCTLARPVQEVELRIQGTICKAVNHAPSAAPQQITALCFT